MINEGFCTKFFFRIPWNFEAFLVNIYPGLDFFYVIFWYFFLLLLWSIICHQLFLLLVTFIFGPMGKTATCLIPRKIGRDAHNLQPLNGLISKKKKAVAISHQGTTMWLTINVMPLVWYSCAFQELIPVKHSKYLVKGIHPQPWFCFPIANLGQRFRNLFSKVDLEMIFSSIDDY